MTTHSYSRNAWFDRIGSFLDRHHRPGNRDRNWLQPAWEYMHFHPAIDGEHLDRCAVWEDDGELVGVAHYEWSLGEAFFQVAPDRQELKPAMPDHVEAHMRGSDERGEYVAAYCGDADHAFAAELARRGYSREAGGDRPLTMIDLRRNLDYELPGGFRIQSLADENDLAKIDRCLWRGFDHEGEPDGDLDARRLMQSGPKFRHDLTIVVVEPGGDYVAFSGAWHDRANRFAYIEPVATDPDFRRMGLGRAAVFEGLRRCVAEGATAGYVGSNLPFYLALGFRALSVSERWIRRW
ncbi:MAG: GNAT family N-acetyltransferase [Spirochaetota bacterium]